MIRFYLAARYSRREELEVYRAHLHKIGHLVTSRWLNGNHQVDDRGLSVEGKEHERTRFATEDWDDLMAADWCISFTEAPRSANSRGGRHVEFGAALAAGKKCVVVGPRENVFHCLPNVEVYETWDQCLAAITAITLAAIANKTVPDPRVEKLTAELAWARDTFQGLAKATWDWGWINVSREITASADRLDQTLKENS